MASTFAEASQLAIVVPPQVEAAVRALVPLQHERSAGGAVTLTYASDGDAVTLCVVVVEPPAQSVAVHVSAAKKIQHYLVLVKAVIRRYVDMSRTITKPWKC